MSKKGESRMTVIEIKHAAKRQEWIMECRGSGESVQRWCKEHQVSATTYYRQEREIFGQITKKEKESRLLAVAGPEFVPVLAITPCSTSGKPIMTLRSGTASVDIYAGTGASELAAVCRA